MDFNSMKPLALAVARAGFPVLGDILGKVVPFPGNLVAGAVFSGISAALGTPADNPQAAADAIDANPTAAQEKLQAIQAEHEDAWKYAEAQMALNSKELETGNLFVSGWRPAFAWLCVGGTAYQMFGSVWWHMHVIPPDTFNPIWVAFGGLLGLKSVEKWLGVAPVVSKVKVIPDAVKRLFTRKKK